MKGKRAPKFIWFKQMLTRISPKLNTWVIYLAKFKKPINLKDPKTLDEKIQWLKFNTYYKNPLSGSTTILRMLLSSQAEEISPHLAFSARALINFTLLLIILLSNPLSSLPLTICEKISTTGDFLLIFGLQKSLSFRAEFISKLFIFSPPNS